MEGIVNVGGRLLWRTAVEGIEFGFISSCLRAVLHFRLLTFRVFLGFGKSDDCDAWYFFNVLNFLRCFILFCITWFFNLVCNEDIEVVLFVVACVEFGIILAFVLLLLSVLIPELHLGVWSEVDSDLTYFLLLYFCWILIAFI